MVNSTPIKELKFSGKIMSFITSVSIPAPILEKAKQLGINVSKTSREAVIAAVQRREKEMIKCKP
jgi:post-segregation antitoxin (ccd killing protein)